MEGRLRQRYLQLVMEHLSPAQRVAAGLRALPSSSDAFASTQAAWRFYANPQSTLEQLAGPLIACARAAADEACDQWLLMVLDWSPLHYGHHPAKQDRIALAHQKDLGYQLLTALAVSDRDGAPLAPVALELEAADGVHSTRSARPLKPLSRLDQLDPLMQHVQRQEWGERPLVWIIDREADSVGHYRQWAAKHQRWLLVRADAERKVLHAGKERKLGQVAESVKLKDQRQVLYQGKTARQWVGETLVVLHRPARQHRVDADGQARHHNIAGEPLALRLVVSEVREEQTGKLLARWLLLTNLPAGQVPAETVALWYYWRWRIESYHKLLKGAGQHLEHWQQETAAALARRLTVAAMAGVVVWRLARDPREEAGEMRQVLVRLSGRQMKRGKESRGFTEPALLAGLGVLVPMLELLEQYEVSELRRLADATLPRLRRGAG